MRGQIYATLEPKTRGALDRKERQTITSQRLDAERNCVVTQHLLDNPSPELVTACVKEEVSFRDLGTESGLVGFLTQRASTRTRVSVAAAAHSLGLGFLELPWASFYGNEEVHLLAAQNWRSEMRSLALCGVRVLVARLASQDLLESLARDSPIPVINGCTDRWHPLQLLADLRALHGAFGALAGLSIAFVGNAQGSVARSLLVDGSRAGLRVTVIAPEPFGPTADVMAQVRPQARPVHTRDVERGLNGVDAVYTDEWFYRPPTSDERRLFRPYCLTRELLDRCAPKARILHCLPFAEEMESELLDDPRSLIWRQVAERTPATAAVLASLLLDESR